ncbi:MAG: hypothetical protein CME78_02910 [Halomonas sp.]|nr:hypothetical protein [Halomonas sp.]
MPLRKIFLKIYISSLYNKRVQIFSKNPLTESQISEPIRHGAALTVLCFSQRFVSGIFSICIIFAFYNQSILLSISHLLTSLQEIVN